MTETQPDHRPAETSYGVSSRDNRPQNNIKLEDDPFISTPSFEQLLDNLRTQFNRKQHEVNDAHRQQNYQQKLHKTIIKDKDIEIAEHKATITTKETIISAHVATFEAQKITINSYRSQLSAKDAECARLQIEKKDLLKLRERMGENITHLTNQNRQLNAKLSTMEEAQTENQRGFIIINDANAATQVGELQTKLEDSIKRAGELQAEKSGLQSELQQLRAELARAKKCLEHTKVHKAKAESTKDPIDKVKFESTDNSSNKVKLEPVDDQMDKVKLESTNNSTNKVKPEPINNSTNKVKLEDTNNLTNNAKLESTTNNNKPRPPPKTTFPLRPSAKTPTPTPTNRTLICAPCYGIHSHACNGAPTCSRCVATGKTCVYAPCQRFHTSIARACNNPNCHFVHDERDYVWSESIKSLFAGYEITGGLKVNQQ